MTHVRAAGPGVLSVERHAGNIGDAARNQRLSQARADAVRAALIALDGSLASRLEAAGFGAAKPVAGHDTVEGRARSRQVALALP